MKSKIEKYLKYVAAAVFVATLAINVVITLDDPFVLLSDEAIATTTSSSSSSGGGCDPQMETSSVRFVYSYPWSSCGVTHPAGIYFDINTVKDCWSGGTSQDCEKGSYVETINIIGSTVCEVGGFVPTTCP